MNKKELKALVEIKDGKMTAIASTDDVDRVGESLTITDWDFKNFKKNPVLQAGHDYKPQFTIGIAKNIVIEGSKVIFEPVFHGITQLAREIKEMYEQGYLKAFSVGFLPGGDDKKKKNELLEISAVAVPANPNALVISKELKEEKVKEIEDWVDTETKEIKEEKLPIPKVEEVETKVGRVLSTKNRKIVFDAREVLKQADVALGELLDASETPEPEKEQIVEEVKEIVKEVEKVIPEKLSGDQVVIRALQKINKNSNYLLSIIKNK